MRVRDAKKDLWIDNLQIPVGIERANPTQGHRERSCEWISARGPIGLRHLGYEEGSSDQPSNIESINFVKSTIIDNNHSAETEKDNQPPRRNERKSIRT
jgi:hypothetical protein